MCPDGPLGQRQPIDWLSIFLLALGLGAFQTFLKEGYSEDWFESTFITVCAIVAAFALVIFVIRQLEAKHPVVDVRILRYRSLAARSLLSVTLGMALYGVLFAVPIFASTVLRYTARDVGMLLLPGAIASAFMMPIASKLMRRYDPRILLAAGGLILVGAAFWLGQLTTSTSGSDLFWPLIVRALGSILMFLPLSMAALGSIPKQDVGAATAFYNLMRQLGGSVGVAMLSTLLGSRATFHRIVVVDHLSVTDPNVQARVAGMAAGLVAKGADVTTAKQQGLALLDSAVRLQSSVLAFSDTFFVTAVVVLLAIPLVFVLGKPAKATKVEAGAH
jgi:DHA2 family multidrug resistance protein